jgi:glycerol-1-phosphate dehydrogenase [NAD(P)+]
VDWLLADKLGIEAIHQTAWDLVQKDLPSWVKSPEKLKANAPSAFSDLFKGLTMTGIAMQVYQDSRPASGDDPQALYNPGRGIRNRPAPGPA